VAPQKKKAEQVTAVKKIETVKPKAKAPTKKGIDAALDGLE